MTQKNSRQTAVETLLKLEQSSTPLPIVFQQMSTRHKLDSMDRALAMNLIYGVLRQQQYLQLLMSRLCKQPVKKLHPLVRLSLAVGLYQIFFLSRIPESAAVNETVNAAKGAKVPKRLHGFINGVLRQSIRQRNNLPQPGEPISGSQPVLNHPQWLIDRWTNQFGQKEMLAICEANNGQQLLTLRINLRKTSRAAYIELLHEQGIQAEPGKYAATAVTLPGYQGTVTSLPHYTSNYFQIQGEAAQLATLLLLPLRPKGRYLDGCAGLGGKTGHLLELAESEAAQVVAVEPEKHRQEKLKSIIEKHTKKDMATFFPGTLEEYAKSNPGAFDGILIDAPCSGTGVIGRQPDIRWRRKPADILKYARKQSELLDTAASLVLPGGVIAYLTCSLEPEENIDIVRHFLGKKRNFTLMDPAPCLPKEAVSLIHNGCFQSKPSQHIDGFFGVRLVRNLSDD